MKPANSPAPAPSTRAKVEVPADMRVAIIRLGTIAFARSVLRVSPEVYRELVGPGGRVSPAALERVKGRLAELVAPAPRDGGP